MPSEHFIFVGFELDEAANARVNNCPERLKMYLDDPVHLQRVAVDGRDLIGKKVENGIASDRIEDTARSVVSLLKRIDSEWSLLPRQALILPLSGAVSTVVAAAADGESADEDFEYAALIPPK